MLHMLCTSRPPRSIPGCPLPRRLQVGEFFESVGIDAVLLVQHAGLNPMGAGDPPRAGCPRGNLRRTVEDLVRAGLSVVRACACALVLGASRLGFGDRQAHTCAMQPFALQTPRCIRARLPTLQLPPEWQGG